MTPEQEPKYDVRDGRIVNRATGEPIPDDEPIMILRAKDVIAAGVVRRYHDLLLDGSTARLTDHKRSCFERYQAFIAFAEQHPERMKRPD